MQASLQALILTLLASSGPVADTDRAQPAACSCTWSWSVASTLNPLGPLLGPPMIAARIAAAHALGILPGQGPASCEVAPPPAPTGPALESEFERLSATVDLLLEPFRGMLQRLGPTTFSRVRDGIVRFVVAVRSRADLAPTCSEGCMPDRR